MDLRRTLLSLEALALAILPSACARHAPEGDHPGAPVESAVLITVDTLRADQLGCYGGTRAATPRIDGLAAESLLFEAAYSQATLTLPALTSALTGLVPPRHGVHNQQARMATGATPLASLLHDQGLETGSFVANLCRLQAHSGTVFSEGWDERFCGMDEALDQHLWDESVARAAAEWIAGRNGRFFCWVHLMDPHAEHRPPPDLWDWEADPPGEKFKQYEYMNQWEVRRELPPPAEKERLWNLYAAEVAGVDRAVGTVLDALLAHPAVERTAVIFASDHGEELYETWSRYDHGFSLTEGVLWVPLLVRAPGLAPGRERAVVETLGIAPTVLALLGVEPPAYRLDCGSLLAAAPGRGFALSFSTEVSVSLRSASHRYWFRATRDPWTRAEDEAPWRADAPWFRYRKCLAEYGERRTEVRWLSLGEPEARAVAGDLQRELERFLAELGPLPSESAIADPELERELEALGYAGGE